MKQRRRGGGPAAGASKRRVFVVDDHQILREGLRMLLDSQEDLAVCGEASSVQEGLRAILEAAPDLAIVDLSLENSNGLDLVKDLNARRPDLPVLVLSMHDEGLFAERAIRAGARGYLMKKEAGRELLSAIHTLLSGKIYLSEGRAQHVLGAALRGRTPAAGGPMDRLSDREIEVFEMIGHGTRTRDIARNLHLSVKTVETHRARIKEKLGLPDSAQLVQHAVQWVEKL
ncbi:MAG: response regulator transcription factor [Planctomycetes bacterium]|nr:response regulator transcription factor [Planctomycetota bacterium]